jgi:hypothetical protein
MLGEVDVPLGSVLEPDVQDVTAQVLHFDGVDPHGSLQRTDPIQRPAAARRRPVLDQLGTVQSGPLEDESEHSGRQTTGDVGVAGNRRQLRSSMNSPILFLEVAPPWICPRR